MCTSLNLLRESRRTPAYNHMCELSEIVSGIGQRNPRLLLQVDTVEFKGRLRSTIGGYASCLTRPTGFQLVAPVLRVAGEDARRPSQAGSLTSKAPFGPGFP